MAVDEFRKVLMEWRDFEFPDIKKRDFEWFLDSKEITTFTGVRRAGKSSLLLYIARELLKKHKRGEVVYINFEHELLRDINVKDLRDFFIAYHEIFKNQKLKYLLMDEIHIIKDWDVFVRRIHDQKNIKLILTDSTSKLLPKEIASSLRGRTINQIVYPLSFKEFLDFKGFYPDLYLSEEQKGMLFSLLNEYLEFGSFPGVVSLKTKYEKIKLLSSYFDTILYRDIVETFRIKKVNLLEKFLKYAISISTKYYSASKTEKYLKSKGYRVSKNTLLDYMTYAQKAFLFYPIEIYSSKLKHRDLYASKIYCVDTGLINFVNPRFNENIGISMENIVALNLFRKKDKNPLLDIFYFKDNIGNNRYEIDFLIKEGTQIKELIQVTYASSYEEIPDREIRALLHAKEDLKLKEDIHLTVITWDYEDEREIEWWKKKGTIRFVPLWKWLLQ